MWTAVFSPNLKVDLRAPKDYNDALQQQQFYERKQTNIRNYV